MADRIRLRGRDAATNAAVNEVLALNELCVETDTGLLKIGDGETPYNDLPYVGQVNAVTGGLAMPVIAEPSPPASGLTLFVRSLAGQSLLSTIGPSGWATALQPHLGRNKAGIWMPPGNAVTLPGVFGYTAPTTVGTATARTVTAANMFTRGRRIGYVSSAAAGQLASLRVAVAQITLGDGAGLGGFAKTCRFGISDAAPVAGARMFLGVAASTAAPTNVEPATLTNVIGVGHGAADSTLSIYYGGSVAQTPIPLGADFPANTLSTDLYDLALFSPGNQAGMIGYEVTRVNTGHIASGMLGPSNGINLPATSTLLTYQWAYRTNNATALAVGLDLFSDFILTDN